MGRKVIKLLPDRLIFVGRIESFLHDMAKQGLILTQMLSHFAVFDESEPQDIEYRIVLMKKTKYLEETREAYSKRGWDMVGKHVSALPFGHLNESTKFYIFKPHESISTDEKTILSYNKTRLEEKYKKQKSKYRYYLWYGIIGLVLSIIVFVLVAPLYFPSFFYLCLFCPLCWQYWKKAIEID